jgi:hypothetical protein
VDVVPVAGERVVPALDRVDEKGDRHFTAVPVGRHLREGRGEDLVEGGRVALVPGVGEVPTGYGELAIRLHGAPLP